MRQELDVEAYRKRFDDDNNLKGKRKIVVALSMLLLGIQFTGATVKEANSLIFLIEFTNEDGFVYLLLISILFSLVRYHNFAYSYLKELKPLWVRQIEKNRLFVDAENYPDEPIHGLVPDLAPKEWLDIYEGDINEDVETAENMRKYTYFEYVQRGLDRGILFTWYDGCAQEFTKLVLLKKHPHIGRATFRDIIFIEYKERISRWFIHRETLDIIGPYLIGVTAFTITLYSKVYPELYAFLFC